MIATVSNLIGEIGMLVCNTNLLLEALLFVMKFSEAVFEHLCFHLPLLEVQLLVEFT